MRLTRENKDKLRYGVMIEYQSYFSEDIEVGIVTDVIGSYVYHKTLSGLTKSVGIGRIMSFYTKEENPEMFL